MKALVYNGRGQRSWETAPNPTIGAETDAIVKIDSATICGTELHILKGDLPEVEPGTVLGHEAVGTVVETGAAVTTLKAGDRVLVSCITSCGRCRFCKEGRYGLCIGGGGWILGHLVNGLQAELRGFRSRTRPSTSSSPTSRTSRPCSSRTSCRPHTRSEC
jgi:alcohol dehydrogenase